MCVAWRKGSRFTWGVLNITHNIVVTLLSGSVPLSTLLKVRFLNFKDNAIEHSYSIINHVTKHACWNLMSVCGRKWCDIVCKKSYVRMRVEEICNEWYETLCNEELDCTYVHK